MLRQSGKKSKLTKLLSLLNGAVVKQQIKEHGARPRYHHNLISKDSQDMLRKIEGFATWTLVRKPPCI